jgi:hypothetical protein
MVVAPIDHGLEVVKEERGVRGIAVGVALLSAVKRSPTIVLHHVLEHDNAEAVCVVVPALRVDLRSGGEEGQPSGAGAPC